jgi:magnesium transporter
MAFFTICVGITILQMSKVDPTQLKSLDRRSTLLLQAARSQTQELDEEKLTGVEDPGMDALRGSFGTMGSIIRAKSARRMSMSSRNSTIRSRPEGVRRRDDREHGLSRTMSSQGDGGLRDGMRRHRLFDNPMPEHARDSDYSTRTDAELRSVAMSEHLPPPGTPTEAPNRTPTIKFDSQDLVHQYDPSRHGPSAATHERRPNVGRGSSATSAHSINGSFASTLGDVPEIAEQPSQENLLAGAMSESEDEAPRVGVVKARSPDRFYRPHARDPFERGVGAHADSLDSIASPVDSTDEDERTEETALATPKRGFAGLHLGTGAGAGQQRGARTPSPRRYPKGPDREDDLNESIGLWHRANDSFGSTASDDLTPRMDGPRASRPQAERTDSGGIRLVTTRPPVSSPDRY